MLKLVNDKGDTIFVIEDNDTQPKRVAKPPQIGGSKVTAEQFWPNQPLPEGAFIGEGNVHQVDTSSGTVTLFPGDWIVTNETGARLVCRQEEKE
jgi:hypothetical protein